MIVKVVVRANSSKEAIERVGPFEYIINVTEPPENNKANIAVIKILSRQLGVPWTAIDIKNPSGRVKIIEIK